MEWFIFAINLIKLIKSTEFSANGNPGFLFPQIFSAFFRKVGIAETSPVYTYSTMNLDRVQRLFRIKTKWKKNEDKRIKKEENIIAWEKKGR